MGGIDGGFNKIISIHKDIDDLAAFLDDALNSDDSSQSSPEDDEDNDNNNDNHNDLEAQLPNDLDTQRIKRRKVAEELENVEELQASTSHSSLEQTLEASKKKDECTHPRSFGEMCILCGQRLQVESCVTFGYIHKSNIGVVFGTLGKLISRQALGNG